MSTTTSGPGSTAPLGTLEPGRIGPRRPVPASIRRPEYVDRPAPARYEGPEVKDAATIAAMRLAGRLAARAMAEVAAHIAPGVTTDELDRIGHEYMVAHGSYPSTLGYRGFPKSLCTSVNEVICHGIPDSTVLRDGDIVNIDITAYLDVDGLAVHGDTDATYLDGVPLRADRAALRLGPPARHRDPARDDLHGRTDAHPGNARVDHVGRRLDRADQGPQTVGPVRAHRPG